MIDKYGNWDGVCACGKKELDGVQCRFGATHLPCFRDQLGDDGVQREPTIKRERLPVARERL